MATGVASHALSALGGAGLASLVWLLWLPGKHDGSRALGATHPQPAEPDTASSASSATAAGADEGAWRRANATLAQQVKQVQTRLAQNEQDKADLERQLKAARAQLAMAENDGAAPRDEFDLTTDDWKVLARTGAVKARYPCNRASGWTLAPEQAVAMGLAPTDAPVVEAAVKREEDRIWQSVAPGCAAIVGSADLARRLGVSSCMQIVTDAAKDGHADRQLVADVRAGNRPMPAAGDLDPYASALMAQTGAMQALVGDLAQTLGPDTARRIAFGDWLGWCSGTSD